MRVNRVFRRPWLACFGCRLPSVSQPSLRRNDFAHPPDSSRLHLHTSQSWSVTKVKRNSPIEFCWPIGSQNAQTGSDEPAVTGVMA